MNIKLILGLAVCAQLVGIGAAFADDAMPATDAPMMADKMKPMMHHKMHHKMHHMAHHMMHHKAMMKEDKMMAPDAPK